jgi:hypothetical protein
MGERAKLVIRKGERVNKWKFCASQALSRSFTRSLFKLTTTL